MKPVNTNKASKGGGLRAKVRAWLDIKDPVEPEKPTLDKDLEKKIAVLNRDMEFWHGQFRKYSFTQCLHCKEKMMVWPYEKTAYYKTKKGYVHHACYDDYLKEKNL